MRRDIIFLVLLSFLASCESLNSFSRAVTPTTIPASDTPSPTPTYTPEPSSTPTSTLTAVPTLTATESAPPLPVGAETVQKTGAVWTAYDSQKNIIAYWLPDPDKLDLGWRQQYVKDNGGQILGWNSGSSEWVGVPSPEGVVDGWVDLEPGRISPVWKIDVSALQRDQDVVIGEFKAGEWQPTPFEILLPDEAITDVHNKEPYVWVKGKPGEIYTDSLGNLVVFEWGGTAILGLKYDKDSEGKNVLNVLEGGNRGISQSNIDIFLIINGAWVPDWEVKQVSDIDLRYLSKIVNIVKRSSVDPAFNGHWGEIDPSISYLSVVRDKDISNGGCDAQPTPGFQEACIDKMNTPGAYRPKDEVDLVNHLGSQYWLKPTGINSDWWKVAPLKPNDVFTILYVDEG